VFSDVLFLVIFILIFPSTPSRFGLRRFFGDCSIEPFELNQFQIVSPISPGFPAPVHVVVHVFSGTLFFMLMSWN
jgi:hypothetical protein